VGTEAFQEDSVLEVLVAAQASTATTPAKVAMVVLESS
jgi:hypothetical protein